jgi:hypothetical protein
MIHVTRGNLLKFAKRWRRRGLKRDKNKGRTVATTITTTL